MPSRAFPLTAAPPSVPSPPTLPFLAPCCALVRQQPLSSLAPTPTSAPTSDLPETTLAGFEAGEAKADSGVAASHEPGEREQAGREGAAEAARRRGR